MTGSPRPCTLGTLFDIASCFASLTAASVDDETHPKVQWDSPMSPLLSDDFFMPGMGYTEGITVDDVVGHRSGMPRCEFLLLPQS